MKHKWTAEGQSDIGRKRTQNQDRWACNTQLGLFLVADGMGGHQGGETAATIATETILQEIQSHPDQWSRTDSSQSLAKQAILRANREIYSRATQSPPLKGMGTTATLLLGLPQSPALTIAQVGDSRAYLLREEGIWQLTRDHSLVQEKLRAGLISRQELRTDRMKNVITRSVGFEPVVEVDLFYYTPAPHDCFLICSDGLSGLVEDNDIHRVAKEQRLFAGKLTETAHTLIELANARGGDDNVTVVIAQYS